jgi:hypothetical protein
MRSSGPGRSRQSRQSQAQPAAKGPEVHRAAEGAGARAKTPPPSPLVVVGHYVPARLLGRGCQAAARRGGLLLWNRFTRRAPLLVAVADVGREAARRSVSNAKRRAGAKSEGR